MREMVRWNVAFSEDGSYECVCLSLLLVYIEAMMDLRV